MLYYFSNIQIILVYTTMAILIISSKVMSNNKNTNAIIKIKNDSISLSNKQGNSEWK